uniref:Apple domain-containing protein n=1 Tax=Sipha flava TaxID=143950 RepID=A0A2S2R1U8_9HEMI
MHALRVALSLFHVLAAASAGSFLKLGINDCFERVSIGKRLNSSDVTKTIYTTNIKQCSNECERIVCNAYSYGLSGNGNGTCLLGLNLPKSELYDDPDYDLFMKILQCRDRTMCFMKLVGGRRLVDKYIQRILPVESKGDCELYCEYEKEFRCEGFNFRYDMKLDSYSSCQLTSVPSAKLDLSLDFQSDLDYDFFEKNVNASPTCRYLELTNPYGQRRNWGIAGNQEDLWQDLGPLWYQRNEIAYGADKVYYDTGLQPKPGVPEYDGASLTRPNDNPYNNFQLLYNGIQPSLSVPDRQPLSPNECFIKARTGHHLQRENIIKSTNAQSLYGCETICANEQTFTCNIFSYRYSYTSSMDNCHLGDKMLRQLDIFQDLVPDRDCDVFVRNELSQPGCQPARNWDTDCFERIRSGLTLERTIVKFSVQADNLHECELICLHVKHFTCRVFSFRRGPSVIGKWSDNCYLTDYPVTDMDPTKHFVDDSSCDVYNRGSFGRGCELDKIPPSSGWPLVPGQDKIPPSSGWPLVPGQDLTPTVLTTYRPQYGVPPPLSPGPSLYGPKYGPPPSPPVNFYPSGSPSPSPPVQPYPNGLPPSMPPVKFYPSGPTPSPLPSPSPSPLPPQYFPTAPPPTLQPPTIYIPVKPTVFIDTSTRPTGTFVPSQPPTTFFHIPGEYTPVSAKPVNRDPIPGGGFYPYGKHPNQIPTVYGTTGKKMCYINFGNTARLLPSAIKKSMNVESEYKCKMECNEARENHQFRCSTLSYFEGYCELSDIEMANLKPNQDFTLDQQFLLFAWDFSEVHCFGSPAAKFPPTSIFPAGKEWTWMRFTVNGQPCKSGSYCTQNNDVGVWSCPIDQGDWGYCCRPDHKCGYSEGISYPWCHVGVSVEQWRPCSDKYYPTKDGPAQTWPVTYIHNTGPPATSPTGAPYPFSPPTPGSFYPSIPPTAGSNYPSGSPPLPNNDSGGGGNVTKTTTEHIQTLIDQFLSIFKSSSPTETTTSHAMLHEKTPSASTSQHVVNGNVDSLPGFQVVDVTDKPQTVGREVVSIPAAPANRLYSYGNRFIRRKPFIYLVQ